jgi:hypothetical protein
MIKMFLGGDTAKSIRIASAAIAITVLAAFSSRAQIYTLTDGNSHADVSVNSSAGMSNWYVDNQNQLAQQWFWYRIGATALGNPDAPINSLSAAIVTQPGLNSLKTTYQNAQLRITVNYSLFGQDPGTGGADMAENIQIKNISANPYELHFFQYSDFNLDGTPGGDNVALSIDSGSGLYSGAIQTKNNISLTETVQTGVVPFASHGEAGYFNSTLVNLGTSYNLNDNVSAGPGDVTWALQWDFTLAPGAQISISKDKLISGVQVPEPTTLGLGFVGISLLSWHARRRAA